MLAATLLLATALLLPTTLGWGHSYSGHRTTRGPMTTGGLMTTGGGLAGSLPRLSRRWHYRGSRRRILGGSAQGGGVAIAQHPKTEVVQRVGEAVIDRCER